MTTTPARPDEDARLRVLYGDPALAPPARTPLQAGPFTLIYTSLGDLRYIRWGHHEVVRRLYHAVRDERWGTVPAEITVTEQTVGPDSFRIAYEARHRDASRGIDFLARVTLSGEADGTVTYEFDGEALSTFFRNRIGVCVLHPAQDCKARPCRVTHPGGDIEEGAFPDLISPHQPFFDIAAIEYGVGDTDSGVTARIDFSGDVFEMEDQRNWLDASYKTYSTPLALPMPVEVPAGTRIRQTVTLSVTGADPTPPPAEDGPVVVTLGEAPVARASYLSLSLQTEPSVRRTSAGATSLLSVLNLYGLRVRFDAAKQDWLQALAEAEAEAVEGGYADGTLVVALHNADRITERLPYRKTGCVWLLFSSHPDVVKQVSWERRSDLTDLFGGGSHTNFTELNRNRPGPEHDEVAFAGNPQVHAFDALSIMETPPMIAEALQTVDSFLGDDTPLHVGPLTLYGLYRGDEPRHRGLFGAAWYLASLAYAAQNERLTFVTLCDTVGPHGVVAEDGSPHPVYFALAALGGLGSEPLADTLPTVISDRLVVACLATEGTERRTAFLVNLTPDEQAVTVRGLRAEAATVRVLDETNALTGFSEPRPLDTPGGEATLTLLPYAIAEVVTAPTPPPASRVPGSPAAGEGS